MYEIKKLEWDSKHFNKVIGDFKVVDDREEDVIKEDYDVLISKIDVSEKKKIIKLENMGFNLMDTLITFSLKKIISGSHNKNIFLAEEKDINEVSEISKKAYRMSHFYFNEKLEKKEIDELYGKWIKNKYKQGQKIYVYKKNDIIQGFLLEKISDEEAIIELIAVNEEFKGQKIGKSLVEFFFNENLSKKGFVGTQISNIAAIKLYENMGYKIEKFTHIFHKNKR